MFILTVAVRIQTQRSQLSLTYRNDAIYAYYHINIKATDAYPMTTTQLIQRMYAGIYIYIYICRNWLTIVITVIMYAMNSKYSDYRT